MAKTRAIVRRRKAVRNIRKITKTMELIATARFKKAMDRAQQAEAYTRKIGELVGDLSRNAGGIEHPLLVTRPVKTAVMLVITSNRGLCGGYNSVIIREAAQSYRKMRAENDSILLEVSGKRVITYARFQGWKLDRTFTQFEDKPTYAEVERELGDRYIADYIAGRIDRLDVAYMKFLNAGQQTPVVETLLPLSAMAPSEASTAGGPAILYEFLPDAESILRELLPVAFKIRLFKCFLDAAVSEQIARRVAMKAATDNAGELLKQLSREYNRARQSQITTEISEVIGGAAALE